MSYLALGREIMYKANQALISTPVRYMEDNAKVLGSINYNRKGDYVNRIHDLFRKQSTDRIKDLYKKERDGPEKDNKYDMAQSILYRAALNPSKN